MVFAEFSSRAEMLYNEITNHFACLYISEEVILAEERTTQEERNHIMEARKRAANKRRKMKLLGKSKSTETDEDGDDEDADEGKTKAYVLEYKLYNII